MKDLWRKIWYAKPVVFVGSLVSAWVALVAFDQASDSWEIPTIGYIIAVPVVMFLTAITQKQTIRNQDTPVE